MTQQMPESGTQRARDRAARPLSLLLLCLLLASTGLAAAPRIGVLTMGPGAEYWSRFGHNALLVEQPDGQRTVYNYGFFDFEQPGFLLRFARGQMRYQLVALPFEQDFAYYQSEGRGMQLQWLRLDPQQAAELAGFLAWNALPENAEYDYDYFLDNCSTRVRDALNDSTGDLIKVQTRGRSRGLSYRSEALRLSAAEPWMFHAIHLLLGPAGDHKLSRWEESFVPARLHDALNLVMRADGQALVESDTRLLPQRLAEPLVVEPRFSVLAAVLGIAAAALALMLARRRGAAGWVGRGLLLVFWLFCGLVGVVGLLLWGLSEHAMAYANRSLLLFNPLVLGLFPALFALARQRTPAPWQRRLAALCGLMALAALPLYLLPARPQDHLEWILLALPLHIAAWRLISRSPEDP